MENSTSNNNIMTSQNPLAKYFRQPAIYMKLPSLGRFWGENSLELPVTGEIPVYPMTARDEVTLRTPDSLMNGQGVVDVIQSCCPNIKDAWHMPSVDVDAVLIGIRIASYGNEMDLDTTCPFCQSENSHALDLSTILNGISCPNYVTKIEINNLKIKVKPQEFITVGGHIDAWDIAEGANDDGGGCIQAIELIRIYKKLGIKPERTIRAVMFMNEEKRGEPIAPRHAS